jgi:hypothetical protein
MNSTKINFNIINNSPIKKSEETGEYYNRAHNVSGIVDRLHAYNYNDDY